MLSLTCISILLKHHYGVLQNHNRRRKVAVVAVLIIEMIILSYCYKNLLCMRCYKNYFRQVFTFTFLIQDHISSILDSLCNSTLSHVLFYTWSLTFRKSRTLGGRWLPRCSSPVGSVHSQRRYNAVLSAFHRCCHWAVATNWDLQLLVLHGERCGTQAIRFLMALMISGQSEHLNSCLSKMVPGSRKREPITAASCVPLQTDGAARELWHRKTWVKRMQIAVYSFAPTFQQGDHL